MVARELGDQSRREFFADSVGSADDDHVFGFLIAATGCDETDQDAHRNVVEPGSGSGVGCNHLHGVSGLSAVLEGYPQEQSCYSQNCSELGRTWLTPIACWCREG